MTQQPSRPAIRSGGSLPHSPSANAGPIPPNPSRFGLAKPDPPLAPAGHSACTSLFPISLTLRLRRPSDSPRLHEARASFEHPASKTARAGARGGLGGWVFIPRGNLFKLVRGGGGKLVVIISFLDSILRYKVRLPNKMTEVTYEPAF